MTVPAPVSADVILKELPATSDYAAAAGLEFDSSALARGGTLLRVTLRDRDGESFYAEIDCRDYPMYPPMIEFTDAERRERGIARLYPRCFHATPCVCTRYSRKAYQAHGGPHGDWRLIDWQLPTSNGVAVDTLAMILSDLHSKISQSTGRLG
jgi:hypothetical protein